MLIFSGAVTAVNMSLNFNEIEWNHANDKYQILKYNMAGSLLRDFGLNLVKYNSLRPGLVNLIWCVSSMNNILNHGPDM